MMCTEQQGPLNRIVLKSVTIPLGQNSSRQGNMISKINFFPDLLTTSNVRSIKQKAIQTPSREAEKTCEKLIILIEKSKTLGE